MSEVDVEERHPAEVQANAGYEVRKLSLIALAQQVLAERAKATMPSTRSSATISTVRRTLCRRR